MERLQSAIGQSNELQQLFADLVSRSSWTAQDLVKPDIVAQLLDGLAAPLDARRRLRLADMRQSWPDLLDRDIARDILDAVEARGMNLDLMRRLRLDAVKAHPADGRKARVAMLEAVVAGWRQDPELGPLAATIQEWRKVRNAQAALTVFTVKNRVVGGTGAAIGGPIGAIMGLVAGIMTAIEPAIQRRIETALAGLLEGYQVPADGAGHLGRRRQETTPNQLAPTPTRNRAAPRHIDIEDPIGSDTRTPGASDGGLGILLVLWLGYRAWKG